jgi:O-antigen/teichoic acid export membrane protein
VVGFLLAEVLVCGGSAWLSLRSGWRLRPLFSPRLIVEIVQIGLPITIIWWAFILQVSADRVIAMSTLGPTATGLYGLGVSIVSLVILLPVTISRVLYPRLNERTGQTSNPQDVSNLVVAPAQVLGVLLPVGIGLLVVAAPFVYTHLLPKYAPGLVSAQILLLGSFFTCIVRPGANFLVARNRQHRVLGYILLSLSINVGLNIAMARSRYGIAGIAAGSSVSSLVLSTLVWLAVFAEFEKSPSGRLSGLLGLYLPHAVMVSLLGASVLLAPRLLTTAGVHQIWMGAALVSIFALILLAVPAVRQRAIEIQALVRLQLGVRLTRGA